MSKARQITTTELCTHSDTIQESGFEVCKNCGLVLSDLIIDSNYAYHNKEDHYAGITIDKPILLRPKINTNTFPCFSRLGKLDSKVRLNDGPELRTLTILDKICKYLSLPNHIKKDSAFKFQKLINYAKSTNQKIANHIALIFYCIWDSIRFYKDQTTFDEVYKAFRIYHHAPGKHLIVRRACIYSQWQKALGMKVSSAKQPRDYIERNLALFNNHTELIRSRMERKRSNSKSPTDYLTRLRNVCYEVLDKLEPSLSAYSKSPVVVAASIVYFADLIITKRAKTKRLLTQKIVSDVTKTPEYSIRDTYVKYLSNYLVVQDNLDQGQVMSSNNQELLCQTKPRLPKQEREPKQQKRKPSAKRNPKATVNKEKRTVTLNLPERYLIAIQVLIDLGLYLSRSEAIRQALSRFLSTEPQFFQSIEEKNIKQHFNNKQGDHR